MGQSSKLTTDDCLLYLNQDVECLANGYYIIDNELAELSQREDSSDDQLEGYDDLRCRLYFLADAVQETINRCFNSTTGNA